MCAPGQWLRFYHRGVPASKTLATIDSEAGLSRFGSDALRVAQVFISGPNNPTPHSPFVLGNYAVGQKNIFLSHTSGCELVSKRPVGQRSL
jgi:hypothetical protein